MFVNKHTIKRIINFCYSRVYRVEKHNGGPAFGLRANEADQCCLSRICLNLDQPNDIRMCRTTLQRVTLPGRLGESFSEELCHGKGKLLTDFVQDGQRSY